MAVLRSRAPRWVAAGLGLLLIVAATLGRASAAVSSFDVGDQVVVNVTARGPGNHIEIRGWDRPVVAVDGGETTPEVTRRSVSFGGAGQPLNVPVPPVMWRNADGSAMVVPPESFPLANVRPGPHDVVLVRAEPGSHLVVIVPATTAVVRLFVGGGATTIDGYRGANLLALQNTGQIRVQSSATTAFVQLSAGRVAALDSAFERVRVRANAANVVFEACRSKQIETTTIRGNVVYDGGSFDPGLARFESQTGNIALGVTGPAQLSARSQNGRVFTAFEQPAAVQQQGPGTATATYGRGGPLVNALTGRGNVLLYDGSLRGRRIVPEQFRRMQQRFTQRVPPITPRRQAPFRQRR